jgi:hypothetical protein
MQKDEKTDLRERTKDSAIHNEIESGTQEATREVFQISDLRFQIRIPHEVFPQRRAFLFAKHSWLHGFQINFFRRLSAHPPFNLVTLLTF